MGHIVRCRFMSIDIINLLYYIYINAREKTLIYEIIKSQSDRIKFYFS